MIEPTVSPATPSGPSSSVLESVAVFCGNCSCGCPELFVDASAPAERQVVSTDDFGQKVEMSIDQLGSLVEAAKTGALDDLALTG